MRVGIDAMDEHAPDGDGARLTCRELAQAITDYWEGALSDVEAASFERHLARCKPCEDYLEQMRLATTTVAALREVAVPERTRAALIEMFRAWKAERERSE